MKNETLQIRISETDKKKLQQLAVDQEMTMSEYIVFLIRLQAEKEK